MDAVKLYMKCNIFLVGNGIWANFWDDDGDDDGGPLWNFRDF